MSLNSRTVTQSARGILRPSHIARPASTGYYRTAAVAAAAATSASRNISFFYSIPKHSSPASHLFHTTSRNPKGLQPDTSEPEPPSPSSDVAAARTQAVEPAPITTEEYHEVADAYIDKVLGELEKLAEDIEKGLEVEYSVCLLHHSPSASNLEPPPSYIMPPNISAALPNFVSQLLGPSSILFQTKPIHPYP